MAKVLILGATGALGGHLTQQAIAERHDVAVVVRSVSKLPAELREQVVVHQADLARTPVPVLRALFQGHDAVINAAGHVTEGQDFVDLVGQIVTGLEALPDGDRPVSWFLAGAALLDLDDRGLRAVDFPPVAATYWPHRANYERIRQAPLDWRILCPGPMVHRPPLGLDRLRISIDRAPIQLPSSAQGLPADLLLPSFVQRVKEMVVPYADAAALILANLAPGGAMSRHRVGLALPVDLRAEATRLADEPSAA